MSQNIDETLGEKYGDYAGFTTDSSPYHVDHYGEDPLVEVKRLLEIYIKPDSVILDVGCGGGQTLCQFAPKVKEAWGFDGASDLLEGARERARRLGLTNVHWVEGDADRDEDIAQLPNNHFDIAYTESGPDITAPFMEKLKPDAYVLQEIGGHYSSHHLHEILGRVAYTNFANHTWDQGRLLPSADMGLLPVSFKQYFWDVYFRDLAHLEAYVSKEGALSNWQLDPRPYHPKRDRVALELYAQYNTTPKGIRMLYHVQILVWRRTPVHYYPIDNLPNQK